MNGHEFAQAHGNDSSDWTPADFDTEMNLAEIDRYLTTTTAEPQPAA